MKNSCGDFPINNNYGNILVTDHALVSDHTVDLLTSGYAYIDYQEPQFWDNMAYITTTSSSYVTSEYEEETYSKYLNGPLKLKNYNKEKEDMKKLYEVFVVDKDERILMDGKRVIAEDEREAEFTADVATVLKQANVKPKDVTILTMEVGEVKVRKEPQEVKVIKD